MRSLISKVAALGLCACALLAACSPQDGSAPPAAAGSSKSAPTTASNDTGATPQTAKQAPAQTPPADQTRRISIEESQAAIASGDALLVDVRDENTYKTSHIKGAKNIPLPRFEARIGELPKDKLIITYCA